MITNDKASRDSVATRLALASIVTDPRVIASVAPRWDGKFFPGKWSNLIAGWSVDHYTQHGEPIGPKIRIKAERWAATQRDRNVVDSVDRFIESIGTELEDTSPPNHGYVIDLIGKIHKETRLALAAEQMEVHRSRGDIDKAYESLSGLLTSDPELEDDPELGGQDALDTFAGGPIESLIKFNNGLSDLAEFFGPTLHRGAFVAFFGSEKASKSYWLLELAYRAMLQRKRTVLFVIGDMTRNEINKRIYSRAAHHPFMSPDGIWPYEIKWPTSINIKPSPDDEDGRRITEVGHKTVKFDAPITGVQAKDAWENVMLNKVRSRDHFLRRRCYRPKTVTVTDLLAKIKFWEATEGWIPDAIICDYADNLAAPHGTNKMDERGQVNRSWIDMRSMSMERSVLLITASQANSDSYKERWLMSRRHFSEDKRKLGHASAVFGINVSADDKDKCVSRLNYIVRRDGDFSYRRFVSVAGCLGLCCPAVLAMSSKRKEK